MIHFVLEPSVYEPLAIIKESNISRDLELWSILFLPPSQTAERPVTRMSVWLCGGRAVRPGTKFSEPSKNVAPSPVAAIGSRESVPFFSSHVHNFLPSSALTLWNLQVVQDFFYPPPLFYTAHGSCRVVRARGWWMAAAVWMYGLSVVCLCESGAVGVYHMPPPGKMFTSIRVRTFPVRDS